MCADEDCPAGGRRRPIMGGSAMARTLFSNVSVLDGSGAESYAGQVLIEDNRIKAVARAGENIAADGAERIDGGGATLMPGLVEAHCHISFTNSADLES